MRTGLREPERDLAVPSKVTIPFALRLPAGMSAELTSHAASIGLSRSELVRQIIIDYFMDRQDSLHEMVRHARRQTAFLERLMLNDPDPDIIAKIDRQIASTPQTSRANAPRPPVGGSRHGA